MVRWRRWVPGSKRGVARGVAVYGVPHRADRGRLDELLSRCERLRGWARVCGGFVLSGVPEDLELLDQAIDEWHHDGHTAALGNEAGLFLGTVIIASVAGARWQLWPNGHPVLRLASGRELDVVALGGDRVSKGTPPAYPRFCRRCR